MQYITLYRTRWLSIERIYNVNKTFVNIDWKGTDSNLYNLLHNNGHYITLKTKRQIHYIVSGLQLA